MGCAQTSRRYRFPFVTGQKQAEQMMLFSSLAVFREEAASKAFSVFPNSFLAVSILVCDPVKVSVCLKQNHQSRFNRFIQISY